MKSFKDRVACACLCLMLIGSAGCIAVAVVGGAAAGVGSVLYVEGSLKTTFGSPAQNVHDATVAALKDLGTGIVLDKTQSFSGEIESALREGDHVEVHIKAVSPTATELNIRIGVMGDQAKSEMILRAIENQLNTGATSTGLAPSRK